MYSVIYWLKVLHDNLYKRNFLILRRQYSVNVEKNDFWTFFVAKKDFLTVRLLLINETYLSLYKTIIVLN